MSVIKFLDDNESLMRIIWEYAYEADEMEEAIGCLKYTVSPLIYSKNRIFIIDRYMSKNKANPEKIDIGVNTLMSVKFMTEIENTYMMRLYMKSVYKPSIRNTIERFMKSCKMGMLGITEMTLIYIQNEYINKIADKKEQNMVFWLIMQWGYNITDYTGICKFINVIMNKIVFKIDKYKYGELKQIIKNHGENIFGIKINDGDIIEVYNKIASMICQIIDEQYICNMFYYNKDNNNNNTIRVREFINAIERGYYIYDIIELLKELICCIEDKIILWFIIWYGINASNREEIQKILKKELCELDTQPPINNMLLITIQKYRIFHYNVIHDNEDKIAGWQCKKCTFINYNMWLYACTICWNPIF